MISQVITPKMIDIMDTKSFISDKTANNIYDYEMFGQQVVESCLELETKNDFKRLMSTFETILYDCDGLLNLLSAEDIDDGVRQEIVTEIRQVLQKLQKLGKQVIYTTNTSQLTRDQMHDRLKSAAIETQLDQLFPTSYVCAVYLKAIGFDRQVVAVGSDATVHELTEMGIQCTDLPTHCTPNRKQLGFASFKLNPDVGAVIIANDQYIPLPTLVKACAYASKSDCLTIVTNSDMSDSLIADNCCHKPDIRVVANKGFVSLAKPHYFYWKCIQQKHRDLNVDQCLIITDGLDRDIEFGCNVNIRTLFVKSNTNCLKTTTTTTDQLFYDKLNNNNNTNNCLPVPDYYVDSYSTFNNYI
ncbi:glycerol-3-phosphate phosphatase-like [Oppia nitens]|uniref:glycerol-3-phosphate phosphatase-like n=1 Tax=Oppia nitens TaxID=1686743 RepID=UPI0023DC1DF5|nr:glycerol-3-phosphate phosphatase-like [Oppia nitens]